MEKRVILGARTFFETILYIISTPENQLKGQFFLHRSNYIFNVLLEVINFYVTSHIFSQLFNG